MNKPNISGQTFLPSKICQLFRVGEIKPWYSSHRDLLPRHILRVVRIRLVSGDLLAHLQYSILPVLCKLIII